MQWPYDKLPRISSPFGWRVDPLGRAPKKHHNGADFAAAGGTPIESICDGKVIFAGPSKSRKKDGSLGGFGYYVRVLFKWNGDYFTVTYCHMQEGSLQVKTGQKIWAGQVLGKTGTTGDSTGNHLHLEINKGKTYKWSNDGSGFVDPIAFIKAGIAAVATVKDAPKATPESAPIAPLAVHDKAAKPKTSAAKPQPAKAKPTTYKVKSGDSYWSIAQKHGLDFKVLQKLNNNKPLHPNEVIKLK